MSLPADIYGWLYEQNVGSPPAGLEVHAGTYDIIPIPYDGGAAALEHLKLLRDVRMVEAEFYEPVVEVQRLRLPAAAAGARRRQGMTLPCCPR